MGKAKSKSKKISKDDLRRIEEAKATASKSKLIVVCPECSSLNVAEHNAHGLYWECLDCFYDWEPKAKIRLGFKSFHKDNNCVIWIGYNSGDYWIAASVKPSLTVSAYNLDELFSMGDEACRLYFEDLPFPTYGSTL